MSGMSQLHSGTPTPAPPEDSGVTQADRLTVISPGAALSPFRPRFLCWHRPLSWRAPRLAPRPWDCWPGEQVASGFGQRLSPAAGRPELEVGVWEFPPWLLLLPEGAQDLGNVPFLP